MILCVGILTFNTSCNDNITELEAQTPAMQTQAKEQRVESLIQQARTGDSEAYKTLAICYRDGDGVKKSWLNMMFSYLIYCEKSGKNFDTLTELLGKGHPYRLINDIMERPLDEITENEIAVLAQIAPAEAKAIEIIKITKNLDHAIVDATVVESLHKLEQEGSEIAALLQAKYYLSKERNSDENEQFIHIADRYPFIYQLIDKDYTYDYADCCDEEQLQEIAAYYYKADARAMLTPMHAGKLCVMLNRLEKEGMIEPDNAEKERIWRVMDRIRN